MVKLKSVATIQREIRRLQAIAERRARGDFSVARQTEAYEAYHALRWAIGDLDRWPSTLLAARD